MNDFLFTTFAMHLRRLASLILLGGFLMSAAEPVRAIPAFSGAEGPGSDATGGRGGDVYHVTNLDFDLNGTVPGSLKYGINTAPAAGRTIVFDVGGTIYHDGGGANWWFRSSKSNITIAGQTAPGPGITIAGVGTKFTGDNVILRNIAVRPNKDPANPINFTYDSFSLQLSNSIVDHVSATWFTDEGVSITDAGQNSTVQYATIGEGLNYDGHSYGSIIATEVDGAHFSYHHNLYAHNNSRLPRIGSEDGSTGAILNWSNNVVYNWQSKAGYSGTDQPSRSNFIGNYYIKGASNGRTVFDGGDDDERPGYTRLYQSKSAGLANYFDDDRDGQLFDGIAFGPGDTFSNGQKYYAGNTTFVGSPFAVTGVGMPDTADVALQRVLDYGGANWWNRNPIDKRVIDSVKNGTGSIIADLTAGAQAAEWATVLAQRPDAQGNAPFIREANFDTDGDGMPNAWEAMHGLVNGTADNNGDFDSDGFTSLEEYINDLAAWPAPRPIVFSAATNNRYAQITNWSSTWQPSRFDEAQINSGTVVVDAVGQHAGTLKIGSNAGDNATLNVAGGWLKVEDADVGLSTGNILIGAHPAATAELNVSGGRLITKSLSKATGGSFNFTGGVLSAETIDFDLVNNGGTLAPGTSIGSTEVNGNLILNSGALEIELGSAISFDNVMVNGNVAINGQLHAKLLNGFLPDNDDIFTVLTGALVSGLFANVSGGRVNLDGSDGSFLVTANSTAVILSDFLVAPATIPGDYNNDFSVDAADYVAWRKTGGTEDGYHTWKANFGRSADGGSASNASVPEPAAGFLILVGVAMSFRSTRRSDVAR